MAAEHAEALARAWAEVRAGGVPSTPRDRAIDVVTEAMQLLDHPNAAAEEVAMHAVDSLVERPDILRELAGPFGWCTWCGATASVQADGLIAPHDAVAGASEHCAGSETRDFRPLYESPAVSASTSSNGGAPGRVITTAMTWTCGVCGEAWDSRANFCAATPDCHGTPTGTGVQVSTRSTAAPVQSVEWEVVNPPTGIMAELRAERDDAAEVSDGA